MFFVVFVRLYNEKYIHFDSVLATLDPHISITATVKRNNIWCILESNQLVPGDLILLEGPGTVIPADCRINPIITNYNLDSAENPNLEIRVDQSAVCGRSPAVVTAFPGDSVKMLSKVVVGENILCTVEFTAYNTYIGKIIQVVRQSCTILQMAKSDGTKFDNLMGKVAKVLLFITAVLGTLVAIYDGAALSVSGDEGYNIGVAKVIMVYFSIATTVLSMVLLSLLTLMVGSNEFKTNYRVIVRRLSSIFDMAAMNILCIDAPMVSNTIMATKLNGVGEASISDPLYRCQLESNFEDEETVPTYDEEGNVVEVEPDPPNVDDVCSIYIEDCDINELFTMAVLATKWPDIFHDPSLFDSPDIQLNHQDFAQYIVNNNHANPNFEMEEGEGKVDFPLIDTLDLSLLTAVSDWPEVLTSYQQIHYDIGTFNAHSPDLMCVNNDVFNSNSTGGNPHCIQTMSTMHHRTTGEAFRVIKGAPHVILQMVLNTNKGDDEDEDDDECDYNNAFILQFEKDVVRFVLQGFRVVAVAKSLLRPVKVKKGKNDLDKMETGSNTSAWRASVDGDDDDNEGSVRKLSRKRSGRKSRRKKRTDNIYIDENGNVVQKDDDDDDDQSEGEWDSDEDNESQWGAGTEDGEEDYEDSDDEEEELELCWKMVGLLTFAPAEPADIEESQIRAAAVKDCVRDLNKNCGLSIKVLSSESWWTMKHLLCSCKPGEEDVGLTNSALGIADLVQSPYTVELPSLDADDNAIPPDLKKNYQHCMSGSDAFSEIYPQHKFLITKTLNKCHYDVGFFGQVPTDAAAMVTSSVSFALAGEEETDPLTMLQAVADVLIPSRCVATERSELSGEPTICTASGFMLLPKCVLLARTVLQRVLIIVQHKIANVLFLLLLQTVVILMLSDPKIEVESVAASHGDSTDTHVVIIPIAVMIVSMILTDILCFYSVTNANYTNSSNNDRFYDDYEFSLLSQRNDHVHVTATNTAELDNYEREHDPLLLQGQRNSSSRVNRQTSSSLSDNMAVGPSRFPENLKHVVFNRILIGLTLALVSTVFSGIFIYFITRSMERGGEGRDAVELIISENASDVAHFGFTQLAAA